MKKRVYAFFIILVLLSGALLLVINRPAHRKITTRSWQAMGTRISISLCADKNKQDLLFDEITARINHLEKILSSHMADSELSRLNNLPVNQKMRISDELWGALDAGKRWHSITLGTFDITAGPLIKMWKTAGKNRVLPSDQEIKKALEHTGVEKIVLEKGLIVLKKAEIAIDLGGLGKGFTADNIIYLLKDHGE